MARTQTMVQLSDELIAHLDDEAGRLGISRSALIRRALEEHLAASAQDAVGRRIVEGYRRVPQATPDEWGKLDHATALAASETAQRLDAEERAAGAAPW